jgi:hypothetical protein
MIGSDDTDKPKQFSEFRLQFLAVTMFLVLFIIGVRGYILAGQAFRDAVYATMQLVVLEAAFQKFDLAMNWQLYISSFLLPIAAALSVVALFLKLAGKQLVYFRNYFYSGKIVFLGAGKIAGGIAANLGPKKKIIAVDTNINQIYAESIGCKRGAVLLQDDILSIRTLRRICLHRSDTIYFFTGDDQRNLAVAAKTIDLLGTGKKHLPRLIIDIDDASLLRVAAQGPVFSAYRKEHGGELVFYRAKAQAARMLFIKHPPLRCTSARYQKPVHIGIFGTDERAREVILQAVRHCVYMRNHPVQISVFGEEEAGFDQLIQRHPVLQRGQNDAAYGGLLPVADLRFFHYHPLSSAPGVFRQAFKERGEVPFAKIYVTGHTDYQCLNTGCRISQSLLALGLLPEIVCFLSGTHFITREKAFAIKQKNDTLYRHIDLFHGISDPFQTGEVYAGQMADEIGALVHAAYNAIAEKDGSMSTATQLRHTFDDRLNHHITASQKAWLSLNDNFQWSSRHSGDHVFVKLREIGFSLIPKGSEHQASAADTFSPDDAYAVLAPALENHLEDLKRLEHQRFCIERFLDDWLYATPSLKPMQLNETLVPFETLDTINMAKDEALIRILPHLVKHILNTGRYELIRNTSYCQ